MNGDHSFQPSLSEDVTTVETERAASLEELSFKYFKLLV